MLRAGALIGEGRACAIAVRGGSYESLFLLNSGPWALVPLESEPPRRGRKTGATRENCRKVSKIFLTLSDDFWGFLPCAKKLSKSVENVFDTFWRFLRFFALREKCRKVSKIFLTLFDDFWRFSTWPLSAGPFCGPLIEKNGNSLLNFGSLKTV